jgi:proteic killer suppression protein
MDKAGLHFHQLVGDQSVRFSVRVDRNWRVTFGWSDAGLDAIDVDYEDYH